MKSISSRDLTNVTGGVWSGPRGSTSAAYKSLCTGPTARDQYNWMADHVTPNNSEAPGVKHRVVASIGQLCRWPVPGAPTGEATAPTGDAMKFLDSLKFDELSTLAGGR
jgi:hypothetical protein